MGISRLIAFTAAGLAFMSATSADLLFDWELIDNTAANAEYPGFSGTYWTFDLHVVVIGSDDWTAAEATATTWPGSYFWQHPEGDADGSPPDPADFGAHPALEFDPYWCAASVIGPGEAGAEPTVLPDMYTTDTENWAAWFDMVDTGDGRFSLARYTLYTDDGSPPIFTIVGNATNKNKDDWWPIYLVIPVPTSAITIGAGCAVIGRSRHMG